MGKWMEVDIVDRKNDLPADYLEWHFMSTIVDFNSLTGFYTRAETSTTSVAASSTLVELADMRLSHCNETCWLPASLCLKE